MELRHEYLRLADCSDEVRAAQHELDLEHEARELARMAAGHDASAPAPWDPEWEPAEICTAPACDVDALDDDWTPPDVDTVYANHQRMLARAKAAHHLMPALRAADRILSPAVLAATAAQTQIQIHKLTPRREQLAALLRARLRAIAATLAAQLLPAPRSAATSAA